MLADLDAEHDPVRLEHARRGLVEHAVCLPELRALVVSAARLAVAVAVAVAAIGGASARCCRWLAAGGSIRSCVVGLALALAPFVTLGGATPRRARARSARRLTHRHNAHAVPPHATRLADRPVASDSDDVNLRLVLLAPLPLGGLATGRACRRVATVRLPLCRRGLWRCHHRPDVSSGRLAALVDFAFGRHLCRRKRCDGELNARLRSEHLAVAVEAAGAAAY